jgi:hypothetical protein
MLNVSLIVWGNYQAKKNYITGISFAPGGWGGDTLFLAKPTAFCREKILRILAGTARIVVNWFSQYSCLKVQIFAIIDQLWHAIFPDRCMQLTLFIYHFVERNVSFSNHGHTWSYLLWRARAAKC